MSPPPPPPLPPSPQGILDVIQVAMSSALGDPDFTTLLQTIKGHFYTRDYDAVFTQPLHLPVYAARYTPSRALGYLDLIDQHPQIQAVLQDGPSNVLCLGAGAGGEMVALLAAARRYSHPDQQLTLHIQDYVSWETSLMALEAASRAAWFSPETNHQVRVEYSVSNLLEPSDDLCARIEEAQLVTAMFVLNELFTDRASAMNLVRTLMKHLKPGSLFLLVDSAGSFSNLKIGDRTYRVSMFFDALKNHFHPLVSEDSVWHRPEKSLTYPLEVESMRYFIRLYRKL